MKRTLLILGCAAAAFIFVNAKQPPTNFKANAGDTHANASDTGTWVCDPAHSKLRFSAMHMGIAEVEGYFKLVNGKMTYTKPDMSDAKIQFVVDVNSLNSDNEMRDQHLKSDDFFNAATYPKMVFKSSSFTAVKDQKNKYKLSGSLTIRDVTKPVVFDVTNYGTQRDSYGNLKSGYKATASINRYDYNLDWDTMVEKVAIVGDNIDIVCNLEMKKEEKR